MLKSANLLHKRGLDDSQLHTTVLNHAKSFLNMLEIAYSKCRCICQVKIRQGKVSANDTFDKACLMMQYFYFPLSPGN